MSCRVAPCPGAVPVPMRPPGLGVSLVPGASRGQRRKPEVQTHTSYRIYGAASLVLLIVPSCLTSSNKTATVAMEVSHCSPFQLQDTSLLFDCESLLDKSYDHVVSDPAMDPGYFSASSSLSPTSSVDSFSFSPTSLQAAGPEQCPLDWFLFSSPAATLTSEPQTLQSSRTSSSDTKKSRSRYPGKKRQTASEREKLRMRDLTKALHHLRTYLPPSVAPVGQTLTKIETLRLTIRYIDYLSSQLGLTEEALEQKRSLGFTEQEKTLSHIQPSSQDCRLMTSTHLQPSYQVC